MGDIVERLQDAIDAVHPNSTDEEWTHLLAESMNAADEINALRERVAALTEVVERAKRQAENIGIDSGSYYETLVDALAQQGGGSG